jgi:hypothetical protein
MRPTGQLAVGDKLTVRNSWQGARSGQKSSFFFPFMVSMFGLFLATSVRYLLLASLYFDANATAGLSYCLGNS